ncbi:MAG: hypothetical protein EAX96_14525 [Candidatus Lokiarchaeota archaeon]|nr:hypothetical protein [Candidatus Lokiarchaeota archaeon]
MEIEQLVKNWIESYNYELLQFQNYNYLKIKINDQVLEIHIKELMDSVSVIFKGSDSSISEIASYLNSYLSETTSYEIKKDLTSEEYLKYLESESLEKCLICGELQPNQLKFCLKCGAILEKHPE